MGHEAEVYGERDCGWNREVKSEHEVLYPARLQEASGWE